MFIFFLQGALIEFSSLAVTFHLEALGYTIASIAVADSVINLGWVCLRWLKVLPLWATQAAGGATWLLLALTLSARARAALAPSPEPFATLAVALPLAELCMLLSETCVAAHYAVLERGGVSAPIVRSKLAGKVAGSFLGGVVLQVRCRRRPG